MALGIGPGDEVITTPYTFFATAGAIWRTGARPVFVDIEPDTYNIDPARIEAAITPRTRAIIPVHLYGQTADMDPINEIAGRHGLTVLEDAAQAIGAAYHGHAGRHARPRRRVQLLPVEEPRRVRRRRAWSRPTTRGSARRMARLRVHGMEPKYHHHEVGFNSRLDALQAAVLRVKLRHLDAWTEARREVADRYRSLFDAHGLDDLRRPAGRAAGQLPRLQPVRRSASRPRSATRSATTSAATDRHRDLLPDPAPPPGLLRRRSATSRATSPHAEAAARETIALPMYPELTDAETTPRRRLDPPVPGDPLLPVDHDHPRRLSDGLSTGPAISRLAGYPGPAGASGGPGCGGGTGWSSSNRPGAAVSSCDLPSM